MTLRNVALSAGLLCAIAVFIVGCGGNASHTTQLSAPSGLSYGQKSISAVVGEAITSDTPTVTGTVTAYVVSPALPAGLTLDSTTGMISGTPTAVTAGVPYTVTASNAAGETTTAVQIAVAAAPVQAPSALTYPQTTIGAYVGQAITTDTPSVTGTVTGYSVNPALPAGLTLSTTTGAISGTPTSVTASAAYTVTASNSAGSTKATVQIAVATLPVAPTGLVYPQTTINTYVGQSITPNLPATAGGAITSYAVSPALPAGLTIDPAMGILSGTPTAAATQASYVITGSNASGSATVSVTITVNAPPTILLGPNALAYGSILQFANSNVFTESSAGIWELFSYASGTVLASGDAGHGGISLDSNVSEFVPQAQMAGPTLAIQVPGGIEIRLSADGHVLGIVVSPGYGIGASGLEEIDIWQLASDGSYVALETSSGLYAYAPSGQLLFSRPGNYSQPAANLGLPSGIFAAPGQIQVAGGPANAAAVETISVPGGLSAVGPAYQGTFCTWFADGSHFATGAQDNNSTPDIPVWIYSSSSVQQAALQLPGCGQFGELGGWGNWLWVNGTVGQGNQSAVSVYPVGSSTAILTDSSTVADLVASGPTLALFPGSSNKVGVIDMSGATPVETEYALPYSSNYTYDFEFATVPYAAASGTAWVAGLPIVIGDTNYYDSQESSLLTVDGASLATSTPRYFGQGPIASMAGSTNTVAIATAAQVSWFNPTNTTPLGFLNTTSGAVELSSDGSVLAAATDNSTGVVLYWTSNGDVNSSFSFPVTTSDQFSFSLSGDASTLVATYGSYDRSSGTASYMLQVQSTRTTAVNWSANYTQSLNLPTVISPDGTLVAVTEVVNEALNLLIYKNGVLQATVSGQGLGWLDNSHLLAQNANVGSQGTGTVVYSPGGTVLSTSPLGLFISIQIVNSSTVYSPDENTMYSVTTGEPVWTSPYLPDGDGEYYSSGAVAGSYVVFESEGKVIAIPWQ